MAAHPSRLERLALGARITIMARKDNDISNKEADEMVSSLL